MSNGLAGMPPDRVDMRAYQAARWAPIGNDLQASNGGGDTHNVPTGITITHIHPPTFLYDLPDLAAALFGSSLVTSAQQFIRSLGNGGRQHWIEGQDGHRLVELLVAETLPYPIDGLLRRKLSLLLLLVCIVVIVRRDDLCSILAVVVFVV